jgi:D-glutamate N-acetyltransferase
MAHGVIAYSSDVVVAVVDPDHAGRQVRDVVPYLRSDAPVVASVDDAMRFAPSALLVGIAPAGGKLPDEFRAAIRGALRARLEIVSGLHAMLNDDAEFAALAREHDTRIWDLRLPPSAPLFSGAAWDVKAKIVLTVGSDAAVGKMTAALELLRAARERGADAAFVPTGQIGIAIAGWGTAIDRVVADFAPGAAEQLVLEGERRARDLLFLEGQGGINNPAFAPVTLALLYGGAPDALVLVHNVSRDRIEDYDVPILSYRALIRTYESLCATVKPARVVGIALNTRECTDGEAREHIERARAETGLPCDDVVRNGPHALYDAIAPALVKTEVLHA